MSFAHLAAFFCAIANNDSDLWGSSVFRFKRSSCVAVGTFNIYIIQPQWLTEIGLISLGTQVEIKTDFRQLGFRISAEDQGVVWNVRPDKLLTEAEDPQINCGEFLGTVLANLNWTPIVAVGNNALFSSDIGNLEQIRNFFPDSPVPEEYEEVQKTWHRSIRRESHVFSTQLSIKADEIELALNVHTDVQGRGSHAEVNQYAQQNCNDFLSQRDESLRVTSEMLGMEVHL